MTYILDACAMLALLNEELGKGYETVRGLLESAVDEEAESLSVLWI
jgi:PIN domain nuclease of toxin-antitoxin system